MSRKYARRLRICVLEVHPAYGMLAEEISGEPEETAVNLDQRANLGDPGVAQR